LVNYLGTGTFFGVISNTAGGYSFYRDARLRRITRYRYNGVPADSGGRYLYLRDNGSGANWSPSWQPTQPDLDHHTTEYRERRDHLAYFACSEPLAGFDTQREAFLGAYRGWDRPAAVERGESSNSIAHGWSPHGSHQVRLSLAPGETREVIFLLGYWENLREAKFDPRGPGS
jgi:cellobiose phosphorylase